MTSVEGVGDRKARWRTAVTVLIGVASVLGALATWRLTTVSGNAGGGDATAVQDTISQERNLSNAHVIAGQEAAAFARIEGTRVAASSLRRLADEAAATGEDDAAAELRGEATTLREVAAQQLQQNVALSDKRYVGKKRARFDTERRIADLVLEQERRSGIAPQPEVSIAAAAEERSHSRELGLIILSFGVAIFLLALAEKLREQLDFRLAGLGAVVLAAASVALVVVW
jgi:hypothetical protein